MFGGLFVISYRFCETARHKELGFNLTEDLFLFLERDDF
jgi:hypothetical protein